MTADGPRLTSRRLARWLPLLVRRAPFLLSAYLVPGRVAPRLREATMLGVTSVNRCQACARVHERWARATGLPASGPFDYDVDETAAYRYGQAVALHGLPVGNDASARSRRHRGELEAVAVLMELANLMGNRFLPDRAPARTLQIGNAAVARGYDVVMRVADRAGLRHARERVVRDATGDVLEIGVGTGLNLRAYPAGTTLQAIDPSVAALALARRRADRLGRPVSLTVADAATLPFPDGSFDVVVGTFVLCSVADVAGALRESRRVLRPGGSLRLLEHARSEHTAVARLQTRLAPAWARASGGCRLDHDLRSAIMTAGLRVVEERSRAGGVLLEVVAA